MVFHLRLPCGNRSRMIEALQEVSTIGRRATNRLIIERERFARSERVEGLPYFYSIHLNQSCNQSCIMCMPDGNHPRTLLPFATFVHMYEQFRRYAEHLTLIGGEPLLYPWITRVLELVAQDPVAVTINTNGTPLTEKLTRLLLALHRLELKCSFDAATRNTYKQIRGLDSFNRVMTNIERFSQAAHGRPEIKLIFHYVVMRQNLQEVLPFVDLASRFCPYRIEFFPVRHVSNWQVSNDTGWVFRGRDQCCEFFKDEYNSMMRRAAAACEAKGLGYEVLYL